MSRSHLHTKNDRKLQLGENPKGQSVWQRYGFVTVSVHQCGWYTRLIANLFYRCVNTQNSKYWLADNQRTI